MSHLQGGNLYVHTHKNSGIQWELFPCAAPQSQGQLRDCVLTPQTLLGGRPFSQELLYSKNVGMVHSCSGGKWRSMIWIRPFQRQADLFVSVYIPSFLQCSCLKAALVVSCKAEWRWCTHCCQPTLRTTEIHSSGENGFFGGWLLRSLHSPNPTFTRFHLPKSIGISQPGAGSTSCTSLLFYFLQSWNRWEHNSLFNHKVEIKHCIYALTQEAKQCFSWGTLSLWAVGWALIRLTSLTAQYLQMSVPRHRENIPYRQFLRVKWNATNQEAF